MKIKRRLLSFFIVLFLGIGLSLGSFFILRDAEKRSMKYAFESLVTQHLAVIETRLNNYLQILGFSQAFYDASTFVSREEFKTFLSPFLQRLPSIIAVDWIPVVPDSKKESFEFEARNNGFSNFSIQTRNSQNQWKDVEKHPFYFPIYYSEPGIKAQKAIGLDLGSDDVRYEVLQNSLKARDIRVSPPIHLWRGESNNVGIAALMPVFKKQSFHSIQKDVLETCLGFIQITFDINQLIRSAMGEGRSERYFSLTFTDQGAPLEFLGKSTETESRWPLGFLVSKVISEKTLRLPGRDWKITYQASSEWLHVNQKGLAEWVLLGGLLATIFLGLYIFLLASRTEAIEQAVNDRTAELARINQQLKIEEEKYRSLVSDIPGAVYRCAADKEWTMKFISEVIFDIVGYPASEFIHNKTRNYASIIHPDDQDAVERQVWEGVQRRKPYILEYRVLHADGKIRWVYEKGQGVFSDDQKLLWLDGVIFDITEKRRLSEQLIQAQKMDAIGKLAGGVAHDFNNQLTVITGYSDFLLNELSPSDPKYAEVENIKKAAEQSAKLNRQLLAFGRKQVTMPKVFNPNLLIEDLEKILRSLLGEKISFVTELSSDLKTVKIDPAQLEQVFLNLAMNAKDAMPSGGTFSLSTKNLIVSSEQNSLEFQLPLGDYVVLNIADTGIGMNEEIKGHLFEPFFTTKEKKQGSGLGLATCYGVINSGGGFIQVLSDLGKGTVVKIYLPVSQEKTDLLVRQKRAKEAPRGNENVLLVEDEISVRQMAATILKERGYQVMEAESGEAALKLFGQKNFSVHLLLTDIVMPQMSGRELVDKVKIISPHTKILFMSGHTDDVILRYGVEGGKMNFLQKPFAPKALGFKVREVLDRNRG